MNSDKLNIGWIGKIRMRSLRSSRVLERTIMGKGYLGVGRWHSFFREVDRSKGFSVGEVVFNTAITGYRNSHRSFTYAKQIVTLTHPHVGNVGT